MGKVGMGGIDGSDVAPHRRERAMRWSQLAVETHDGDRAISSVITRMARARRG